MDYQSKYLKYKNKYLYLKNAQKGGTYNHIICLLWFNREKKEIQQVSKDQDLHIKENILRAYNLFKIKYSNPNVVLFLNYDKITDEDFEFFRLNDINNFEVIKSNDKLSQMFHPKEHGNQPLPIYIYVDMLKILIQYECMVYKKFIMLFSLILIFKTNIVPLHSFKCVPIGSQKNS